MTIFLQVLAAIPSLIPAFVQAFKSAQDLYTFFENLGKLTPEEQSAVIESIRVALAAENRKVQSAPGPFDSGS